MDKSLKKLKKEKAMYENMKTFLKEKGIKNTKLIKISKSTKDDSIPEYNIHGSKDKLNFIINIHKEDENVNGNPQVILNIEFKKDYYISFKPLTNGQMLYIINNIIPGEIHIPQTITCNDTKEAKKKSK